MFEYIQGEGGVIALDEEYINAVFELCAQKDILVIADEVQTGIGRTGKLLAGEWYGKKADITTLAKGIAGGIPMGACLFNSKTKDVLTAGTHGSTFGGNPIACAGGIAVIDRMLSEGFLDEVNEKASYIKSKLEGCSAVKSISGKGMMIGITLSDESKKAADIAKKSL